MLDWGDGCYEHTAETLVRAASRAIEAARIEPGERVLDLGCGTGNVALEAARKGARVTGVDPAERLLEVSRARAAQERLRIEFRGGDAGAIPEPDQSFAAVISVFAVIFAPDAELAASEMLRVLEPGGRIVVTSWLPEGGIAEAARILQGAVPADPDVPARAGPRWGDESFVRELFESRGASVRIERENLIFEADSAEAWFDEQERHHPGWRFVKQALSGAPGSWASVRERSIECLRSHSQTTEKLRLESGYLLIHAHRA